MMSTSNTPPFFIGKDDTETSPVCTAGYTNKPPATGSASPSATPHTSDRSVTLTASRSGTIYYTTDGSVPTVSSTNGPSRVSGIIINITPTLKFLAKDSFGISRSVSSAGSTIISPLTVTASPPGRTYTSPQ